MGAVASKLWLSVPATFSARFRIAKGFFALCSSGFSLGGHGSGHFQSDAMLVDALVDRAENKHLPKVREFLSRALSTTLARPNAWLLARPAPTVTGLVSADET